MDDPRLSPLPPEQADLAADLYIERCGTAQMRSKVRRQLERLAPFIARIPRISPRGMRPGLRRLKPRLGAVAWSSITPELALLVRDRALKESTTLRAASASLQPLRGVLRLALAQTDPGRLWALLDSLTVHGVSAERQGAGGDWFEYEPCEASEKCTA